MRRGSVFNPRLLRRAIECSLRNALVSRHLGRGVGKLKPTAEPRPERDYWRGLAQYSTTILALLPQNLEAGVGIGLSGPRTERQTTSLSSRSSSASSRAKFILELAAAYSPARSSMIRTVSGVSRNPKAVNWFSTGRTAGRCPARLARSSNPAVPSKGRFK